MFVARWTGKIMNPYYTHHTCKISKATIHHLALPHYTSDYYQTYMWDSTLVFRLISRIPTDTLV